MGLFGGGGLVSSGIGRLQKGTIGGRFGLLDFLSADEGETTFNPTQQRQFGDNAGAYNSMYGQANDANSRYQTGVNSWEQSRGGYADYLQQQTYANQTAQLGYQQEDAYRQNRFNQARSGMMGGSADMGAQGRIAQAGVAGQGNAYLAGQQAWLGQTGADANAAQGMRQQGYSLYDPANQYAGFAAQNQNTHSGTMYDWRRQSTDQLTRAQNEQASIMGSYLGGVMGSAAGQVGGAAGSYLGNQYKPQG